MGTTSAHELARESSYDEMLAALERHQVFPGTIVIDDKWQDEYGSGTPDLDRWPDLRSWIAGRHDRGQHVLLWWKAWDPAGVPRSECVLDPHGRAVSVDPGNPAYRQRLAAIVHRLLSATGLDADGLKIDFTQRAPAGCTLRGWDDPRPAGSQDPGWGVAGVHTLLRTIYQAAKTAKTEALVITHTPHPGFGDVCDMVRLNDVLERDPQAALVPVVDQLRFRAAVVRASLPTHLVDTDQWPMPDRSAWRGYVEAQAELGVPALYYVSRIDRSQEDLTDEDMDLVARTWRSYREEAHP